MDWPRSTWHFRHRYVSDAWSDQVMVSTITCTQWLVQMKGADCRAYQKAQQQMCTTHPPDQKLKIIQTEYMWYPYDCLVHYIVSSMPFFTSFVAWRSILFNPYITLPALQEIHLIQQDYTNQQSTSFFNPSIMAKIPEWLSLESYRNF